MMVDLHCHILSGMDDGARSFEESLAMAEMAIADGITHVVATPHASPEFRFDYADVKRAAEELQKAVGDRLKLATGCDFHLSPENIAALKKGPSVFCIHQKDYLLVEFNEFAIAPAMDQTLYEIQLAGLRPIITHPERNGILRAQPERLEKWIRNGCYGQVTGGALTGSFGSNVQETSLGWIRRGLVHFIASDAHNTTARPHKLQAAYDVVQKEFGRDKAKALFVENPLAAFEGRGLPHVPEIAEAPPKRKKRFLFF
jgi:protein-tyrosine phosphatase